MPPKRRKKKLSKEEINKRRKFQRRGETANESEDRRLQRKKKEKKASMAKRERKKIAEEQDKFRLMLETTEQEFAECIREGSAKFTKEERALYREENPVKRRRRLKRGVVEEPTLRSLIRSQKAHARKTLMEIGKLKISLGALKKATFELVRMGVESAVEPLKCKWMKENLQRQKEDLQRQKELYGLTKEQRHFLRRQELLKDDYENSFFEKFPMSLINMAENGLFPCVVCDEELGSESGLVRHYTVRHTGSEISKAKETHGLKDEDRDVKMNGTGFVVRVYKCELCSEECYTILKFKKHLMEMHRDNKEILKKMCFPCSFCEEIFCSKKHLILHQKKYHDIFTQCPVCNENMETQESFMNHVSDAHPDCTSKNEAILNYAEGYFCKICGYANKSYFQLKSHCQTHSHSNNFQCQLCELTFKTNICLIRHKLVVHEKISCEVCCKRFRDAQSCSIHKCSRRAILQKNILKKQLKT